MAQPEPEQSKFRSLTGTSRLVEMGLLSAITIFGALWAVELPEYFGVALFREQFLGLFWALVLAAVFFVTPPARRASRHRVPWYDWAAMLLALVVGGNVALFYPELLYTSALPTWDKWTLGAISILLLIEATRRLVGRALLIVLLVFVVYGATAEYWPGLLNGSGVTMQRLLIYLYLDTNALFGIPMVVAATIVLAFVLLGQALFASGGGAFFTDMAMAAMGRYRGGPAKISVVASTLFGTISGTAVSNVVTTGIVTIPLMKRNGYRSEVAGAVESVASTGGQIMPPVMGAAAFLLAEFLEIPYATVVLAALVPALLYYWLLFIQVDLEAAKNGIAGIPRSELPRASGVLKGGWQFTLPLIVLIYTLFWENYQPGKAGMAAVGVLILVTLLRPRTWPNRRTVAEIVLGTGRAVLEITIITGIAGVVIGVLNLTGLGFSVTLALEKIGGGSTVALLLITAALSILLGMGMPTASVYILLAVLLAPGLVRLGLEPLAAHLFILYFGLLSMITPPVAIASFAAAAVANADAMRTGWASVRLGAMAYIVPFIFIYSPELLLIGEPFHVVWTIASTALGAYWLGVALTGYLFRPVPALQRIVLIVSAFALFVDHTYLAGGGYWLNAGGALAGLAVWLLERVQSPRNVPAAGSSAHAPQPEAD